MYIIITFLLTIVLFLLPFSYASGKQIFTYKCVHYDIINRLLTSIAILLKKEFNRLDYILRYYCLYRAGIWDNKNNLCLLHITDTIINIFSKFVVANHDNSTLINFNHYKLKTKVIDLRAATYIIELPEEFHYNENSHNIKSQIIYRQSKEYG